MEQLEAYRIVRQELQNTLSGDAKKIARSIKIYVFGFYGEGWNYF